MDVDNYDDDAADDDNSNKVKVFLKNTEILLPTVTGNGTHLRHLNEPIASQPISPHSHSITHTAGRFTGRLSRSIK